MEVLIEPLLLVVSYESRLNVGYPSFCLAQVAFFGVVIKSFHLEY